MAGTADPSHESHATGGGRDPNRQPKRSLLSAGPFLVQPGLIGLGVPGGRNRNGVGLSIRGDRELDDVARGSRRPHGALQVGTKLGEDLSPSTVDFSVPLPEPLFITETVGAKLWMSTGLLLKARPWWST